MKLFIYSHTHWDREWYLSQTQFQYRLSSIVDGIMEMIQTPNSFRTFVLDGQTSVVEDYLEIRPERRDLLTGLIAEGRLVIGPWFTMPDMFIPDGESLIRNLTRGARDCQKYGAPFPNTGYVPDSFGHIDQLPQILRGVGIDNFVFSRGRPTALDQKEGHKLEFSWCAPDGSRVAAWHLPRSYVAGQFLPGPDQPEALVQRLRGLIDAYRTSHCPQIVLVPHGIDHIWLQREMPAILDALPGLMPDVTMHHGSLEEAVNAWKAALPAEIEPWHGPLRGALGRQELHGTLSSRIDNKLANEAAQVHLENLAEPLEALSVAFGKAAQTPFLDKAWRLVLHNHAHDSICGCSHDRIHADVNTRFRQAIELSTDMADTALDYLGQRGQNEGPVLVAYAGLQGGRRLVEFAIRLAKRPARTAGFRDAAGRLFPVQFNEIRRMHVQHTNGDQRYLECRGVVLIDDMSPCEVRRLSYVADGVPVGPALEADARRLANAHVEVSIQPDGSLNLRDLQTGHATAGTHYFVQEADLGGGYHFEPLAGDQRADSRGNTVKTRLVARGPLQAIVELKSMLRVPARFARRRGRRVGRATIPIVTRITLEAGDPLVMLRTTIDNRASHQRIRLVLPTGLSTREVMADSSFSVLGNHPEKWASVAPHNFHPMRNAVAIAEAGHGLAFMGRGLHEYEIVDGEAGTALEVTFLRSNDFVFQCSTWETPEAQLLQRLTYDYALMPFAGDWQRAALSTRVAAFRAPAIANVYDDLPYAGEQESHATLGYYEVLSKRELPLDTNRSAWKLVNAQRDGWRRTEVRPRQEIPESVKLFALQGKDVVVSACKTSDDGAAVVLRFWSAHPQAQTVALVSPGRRIVQADMRERPLAAGVAGAGTLSLSMRPFEIVTLRLEPNTDASADRATQHIVA